jgi:hypothetical protein
MRTPDSADSCCFKGDFGRCGSSQLTESAHPQGRLAKLYTSYYAKEGLAPPLGPVELAMAVSNATARAGYESDDRFCDSHAFEVDTRLRYELAQEADDPQMGLWIQGPEADQVNAARPLLGDLDEAYELPVTSVDIEDLRLTHSFD